MGPGLLKFWNPFARCVKKSSVNKRLAVYIGEKQSGLNLNTQKIENNLVPHDSIQIIS